MMLTVKGLSRETLKGYLRIQTHRLQGQGERPGHLPKTWLAALASSSTWTMRHLHSNVGGMPSRLNKRRGLPFWELVCSLDFSLHQCPYVVCSSVCLSAFAVSKHLRWLQSYTDPSDYSRFCSTLGFAFAVPTLRACRWILCRSIFLHVIALILPWPSFGIWVWCMILSRLVSLLTAACSWNGTCGR